MVSNGDASDDFEVKINLNLFSPKDFIKKINIIKKNILEKGIIFIKDVFSTEDAILIAKNIGTIIKNIDSDSYGITEISNKRTGNNKKNSKAFTKEGLNLHTDRSSLLLPPNLLMNWVDFKNCTGGESVLVDGLKVFNYIKSYHYDIVDALLSDDVACFTDGIDTYTGSIFFVEKEEFSSVRFRYDQCAFFKLEAKKAINIFRAVSAKLAKCYNFNEGCGYIIKNDRWLHGRLPFEGYRLVKRIHIKGNF